MSGAARKSDGFEHIGISIGSTVEDVRKAYTPNDDIFNDASQSLWVRLSLQGSKEECNQIVERARGEVKKGLPECESPLEKRILPHLVCQDYFSINSGYAQVHVPKLDAFLPSSGVVIVPQMAFMKYRLDFGLIAIRKGIRFIVAIECDGAAYHDPQKDSLRDAYLQSWGVPTVRASGKDVYQSPRGFAQQGAESLLQLVDAAGLL